MGKTNKVVRRSNFRLVRKASRQLLSPRQTTPVYIQRKKCEGSRKKEWKDAKCPICMEFPHKAALLLCTSCSKGCRPFICATSRRHSNCLDLFTEACIKESALRSEYSPGKVNTSAFLCPLCRGRLKGWTVVESAREYLNCKRRPCMHHSCSFVGNYGQLREHVKKVHPSELPLLVDPELERKWEALETEIVARELFSAVASLETRGIMMRDHMIEQNSFGGGSQIRPGLIRGHQSPQETSFRPVHVDEELIAREPGRHGIPLIGPPPFAELGPLRGRFVPVTRTWPSPNF